MLQDRTHPLKIVLATQNPGKVEEMQALLADLPVDLVTTADFPDAPDVEEDASTLAGNASKKALALHEHTGLPALADDTGLEVEALDGAPGVHSARYAGLDVTEADNRTHLLEEMKGLTDRAARFRTMAALALDGGKVRHFEGICRGEILDEERGTGGFGYDPLFLPEGYDQTFAELSPDEKNRISHRGRALEKVAEYLRTQLAM